MVVSFGPNPDYSVQDFLEFLRLLNKREHTEYTVAERTGNEFGDEDGISAKGDSVGPYDTPETITGGGSGGSDFKHPFKLTTSVVDGSPKYRVSKGSITDGTNGSAVSLSGIFDTDQTASAGFVVLEASVSEELVVSGWALAIVAEADAKEVKMTSADPPTQEKLRLVIGKITLSGSTPTAWQALTSSVRIGLGLLNGVEVKVLEHAPTHPAQI